MAKIDPNRLDDLLGILTGQPEWVLVDRRVLDVLLGDLTDLIVKVPYDQPRGLSSPGIDSLAYSRALERREYDPDADGYIWEDDPLC